MSAPLILSIFPGIDLLGMAFEEAHVLRAWAAALVDGEGCISLAKSRQAGRPDDIYYRVDVIVSNGCRELLAPMEALFAGRIDTARKETQSRRATWQWKTTGSGHAAEVIAAIRPWMIAKQGQCGIALEACSLIRRDGYRRPEGQLAELERLKQQMHHLNRRGPR